MKTLITILSTIFIFTAITAHAGELRPWSVSIDHGYKSKEGKTSSESGKLSVNYNTDEVWLDGSIGYSDDIEPESFFGAGLKHDLSNSFDVSAGILWQHNEEDSYLASIRGRYLKMIVLTYQPYLNRKGFIVKGGIRLPLSEKASFRYGMEYRSHYEIFMSTVGVGVKF